MEKRLLRGSPRLQKVLWITVTTFWSTAEFTRETSYPRLLIADQLVVCVGSIAVSYGLCDITFW